MFIVNYRKIFFAISAILVVFGIFSMGYFGFNTGIDFSGGSIIEVSYPSGRPDIEALTSSVHSVFPGAHVQTAGDVGVFVRTHELSDTEHTSMLSILSSNGNISILEKQFNSIGPTIGKELRSKAWYAIIAVILGIVLFIAFAFRKVSAPISSWKYGLITLIALTHDIIIPAGIFAYLGKEINSLFVVALLSILGISVHDKIVVFDRIRENLKNKFSTDFSQTVGESLKQTFARSVNTSMTILIVLFFLWYMGPASTKDFSLLLFIGVFVGTYSSVFFASPLLVTVEKLQKNS